MKESIKCTCGLKNTRYCKNCSKLRVTILLKNGNDDLKVNGYNPVWYSHLKYNRYDLYRVAEKMEANIRKHPKFGVATQVIQFYINGNRKDHIKKVVF